MSPTTAELLEKFAEYRRINPLSFTEEQLNRISNDLSHPRQNLVCDEYVEFILWTKGLLSRQEYFADYVEKLFPSASCPQLLEVGCGRIPRLSRLLAQQGYQMTAMDPELEDSQFLADPGTVLCIKDCFHWKTADLSNYDAVIAQEPCDATEHIIRACTAAQKNYLISLCGTPHKCLNGEFPETVYDWYQYLEEIAGEHGFLFNPQLIPGYLSYVIVGLFP